MSSFSVLSLSRPHVRSSAAPTAAAMAQPMRQNDQYQGNYEMLHLMSNIIK
jgi:hypothetical protein